MKPRRGLRVHREGKDGLSLGNKGARFLWCIVYHACFRWIPPPFHPLRSMLLRMFGARIGRGCHVYPGARVWAPWNLVMGDGASLAPGVDCYNVAKVTLGRNARVSQRAFLCTASHDVDDPSMPLVSAPIAVGEDAWVCAEAFVGPRTRLGAGAVLAARGVALRDVPPWTVVGGNPARVIRPRRRHS